jgi:hypothetical protein
MVRQGRVPDFAGTGSAGVFDSLCGSGKSAGCLLISGSTIIPPFFA